MFLSSASAIVAHVCRALGFRMTSCRSSHLFAWLAHTDSVKPLVAARCLSRAGCLHGIKPNVLRHAQVIAWSAPRATCHSCTCCRWCSRHSSCCSDDSICCFAFRRHRRYVVKSSHVALCDCLCWCAGWRHYSSTACTRQVAKWNTRSSAASCAVHDRIPHLPGISPRDALVPTSSRRGTRTMMEQITIH